MFKKKEVKNKVGRPKLADTKLKKESLIVSLVCVIFSVVLLFIGAYELNIIPNTSKLKGSANTNLCTSIPEELMYNEETNPDGFKDTKFFSAVLSAAQVSGNYKFNNSSYCSTITKEDLNEITSVYINDLKSYDPNGIQYLTNLDVLNIYGYLHSIDLSKNKKLRSLTLSYSRLTEIDLSNNPNLNFLFLSNKGLSSIDLSSNPNLTYLTLSDDNLSNLDLSNNLKLTNLGLSLGLTDIDLSKFVNLESLDLSNNKISNIDLSSNVKLKYLNLSSSYISSIDLSNNRDLTDLSLFYNNIKSIDLSNNEKLINLALSYDNITNIDLSNNLSLQTLDLSGNKIEEIDLRNNINLKSLDLSGDDDHESNLSSVDLSKNVNLESLHLEKTKLTNLDLSNNSKLKTLFIDYNKLMSLDLSKNVNLENLRSSHSSLVSLNLSNCSNLESLDAYNNYSLENLDLPNYSEKLKSLYLYGDSKLKSINLSGLPNLNTLNLNHTSIEKIDLSNNTKLTDFYYPDFPKNQVYGKFGKDTEYDIDKSKIITAYPNDTTVEFVYDSSTPEGVGEIVGDKLVKKKVGQVKLRYNFKISDSVTFSYVDWIDFVELKSDKYNIDNANLIIDAKEDFLSNVIYNVKQEPNFASQRLSEDKVEIYSSNDQKKVYGIYTIQNYSLYKLKSSKYTINDEDKTIDLNNDLLSNANSNITLTQGETSYTKSIVDDKLNILDENKNVIDTYKIVNYRLYKLSSSDYTIDEANKEIDDDTNYFWLDYIYIQPSSYTLKDDENKVYVLDGNQKIVDTYTVIYKLKTTKFNVDLKKKEINLNGELISNVTYSSYLSVKPYQMYDFERKNDNLIIKLRKSGKVVDTFKITNYVNYKLSLDYNKKDTYIIDEKNRTIDLKGDSLYDAKRYIYTGAWNYKTEINDDGNLDIYNSETNKKVDTYTLLNKKENDDNAYLKAGFKDKNLYDAVLVGYYNLDSIEDLKYRYVLSDEELSSVDRLSANNLNISDVTGISKLKGLSDLILFNNNISGLLDLSMMPNLNSLYAENNSISSIKFSTENNLSFLLLHNNKLKSVDLSSLDSLELLTLQNNLIQKVYLLNNSSIRFNDIIKLNNSKTYTYSFSNNDVVDFKDGVINAKKIGSSKISISSDSIITYDSDVVDKMLSCDFSDNDNCDEIEMKESNTFYEGNILVYDVKSNVYKVDNKNNKIDANNSLFDASKVLVEGLSNVTSKVEGNKLIILNDSDVVATYEIVNVKKIDNTEVKKSNIKISNSNNKKKYTVKAKDNKKEKKEENKDLEITDTDVNKVVLDTAKKTSKDLIIKNKDITFTIKHEDIPDNMSGINLDYEIKEADGKKIKEGVVLKFKESKSLPFKILVDMNVKNLKIDDTSFIYKYNKDDKFSLIAENVKKIDNRLKFYVDELSVYNITSNKINDYKDSAILKENKKLNSNLNLIICVSAIFIIMLLIIGIVYYNKNKKKIVSK